MSLATDTYAPLDDTAVYREHHDRLVRVVSAVANASPQTVEDACAFAWLQFVRDPPDPSRALGWLIRVALREVWRLTAEEWRLGGDPETMTAIPSARLEGEDRLPWVHCSRAVGTLKRAERTLVLLAATGYSYKEISSLTGHSCRAVERRLKRARAHLAHAAATAAG